MNSSKLRPVERDLKEELENLTQWLGCLTTTVISALSSYWYLQRLRSNIRRHREEQEARIFFSKKIATGNKTNQLSKLSNSIILSVHYLHDHY